MVTERKSGESSGITTSVVGRKAERNTRSRINQDSWKGIQVGDKEVETRRKYTEIGGGGHRTGGVRGGCKGRYI
jgi:hypothetical protein